MMMTSACVALGYQQISVLTAATGLTVPTGADCCVIFAEGQAVRFRDDATNPTAAIGIPLAVGVEFFYIGPMSAIKFIEQTATAKLNVAYYKRVG